MSETFTELERLNSIEESIFLRDVELISFYNDSGVSQPIHLEKLVGQLQNNYTSPLFNLRNFPKDQSEIDDLRKKNNKQ